GFVELALVFLHVLSIKANLPRFMSCSFSDLAPADFNTLSLHDALPILGQRVEVKLLKIHQSRLSSRFCFVPKEGVWRVRACAPTDRKSTRLNSSHVKISYAVFCLKKNTSWTRSRRMRRCSGLVVVVIST